MVCPPELTYWHISIAPVAWPQKDYFGQSISDGSSHHSSMSLFRICLESIANPTQLSPEEKSQHDTIRKHQPIVWVVPPKGSPSLKTHHLPLPLRRQQLVTLKGFFGFTVGSVVAFCLCWCPYFRQNMENDMLPRFFSQKPIIDMLGIGGFAWNWISWGQNGWMMSLRILRGIDEPWPMRR